MRHSQSLFERVREQEQQAEKFHQVESRILSILDFEAFFETLLAEIAAVFDVPLVWLSLIEESELLRLRRELGPVPETPQLVVLKRERLLELIGDEGKPLLANDNMARYLSLLPRGSSRAIRSIAMTPIYLDGSWSAP
ncbi:MAG: hypothetical protein JXR59_09525 [Desulfuromonadaceae bacterium]|nr:hypothetical protein [Desulfuromonadaceae bacterium]